MNAGQRSPIMEKADTVLGELDNLRAAIGALADHISPYCTPGIPDPEDIKAKSKELEEAGAPLERCLEDALKKIGVLQGVVNDLIARVR